MKLRSHRDSFTTGVVKPVWLTRPNDQVRLDLDEVGGETALQFTLLTPDEPPDQSKTGHLRKRMNHLLFADLRFSYGQ